MVIGCRLEVLRIRNSLCIWMAILRLRWYSYPVHLPHRVLRRLLWASFVVCFLAPWSAAWGGSVTYPGLSRRWALNVQRAVVLYGQSGDVLYGQSRRVSYGRRRWCHVWLETVMSCMSEMTVDSDMGWWHSAILVLSYILSLWPS
jgi:hypothetical protein